MKKVFPAQNNNLKIQGKLLSLTVNLSLPQNCHISQEAPSQWNLITENAESFPINSSSKFKETSFMVEMTIQSKIQIQLEIICYFCKDDDEVCLSGSVIFDLKLKKGKVEDPQILEFKFQ